MHRSRLQKYALLTVSEELNASDRQVRTILQRVDQPFVPPCSYNCNAQTLAIDGSLAQALHRTDEGTM